MADESLLINTGSPLAPYQQFTYTLAAGAVQKIEYVTENFALLDSTVNGALRVNFGGSASETYFEQGIIYKLRQPVRFVQLINSSNAPLTVKVALGCGDIQDNRLSVSGTITTTQTYTSLTVTNGTFDANGEVSITGPQRQLLIQNTGNAVVYVGAANGFQIQAGGSMMLPLDNSLTLYGTAGETVVIGQYN